METWQLVHLRDNLHWDTAKAHSNLSRVVFTSFTHILCLNWNICHSLNSACALTTLPMLLLFLVFESVLPNFCLLEFLILLTCKSFLNCSGMNPVVSVRVVFTYCCIFYHRSWRLVWTSLDKLFWVQEYWVIAGSVIWLLNKWDI